MIFRNIIARFSRNLLLTVALLIPLALAFVIYVRAEKQIDRANDLRHLSLHLATELRQSSDDLTRLVRTYVITGESLYKQQYLDILDIRNGKKPRPEEYWRVYWDLVQVDCRPPRPSSARSVPLVELMREQGFTDRELAKISEAKLNSDRLTVTEKEAIQLSETRGPRAEADHDRARAMVFDRSYHLAKAAIMRPIDDFYVLMEKRTEDAVHAAENQALALRFVFIAFALWLMFMLWRTYRSLYETLGGSVNEVYELISRIGQGNFSADITIRNGQESSVIGWLAETKAKLNNIDQDRKWAEERLRKSEARRQMALEASHSGTWEWDIVTGKNVWSDELWKLYGIEPGSCEPSYESWRQIIHPDDRSKSELLVQEAVSKAAELNAEWRVVRKDGSSCWLMSRGNPIIDAAGRLTSYVGIVMDITSRKQAEEDLKKSNAYLENLFNYANAPIIVWDTNFITTRFNRAFENLTGRSAEHVCDRNISILFPADQVENSMQLIKKTLSGERWETVEIPILHANGFVSTVLWNSATIFALDGTTPVATIAQGHDITKRKQAEQELQNKNEELERFTYSVSHDLKSPLITIQSYAGQIMQDVEAGRYIRVSGDLKRIIDASSKMTALLNDLLALSRAGKMMGEALQIDMIRLVADVLTRLAGPLKAQQVDVIVQPGLPAVRGDQQRITTVLQNLLENAIKYMGDQTAPRITIGWRNEGSKAVFCVTDNGQGIEQRFQENIFGLFNKLDTRSEGTGVGLALTRRIIEVHGGRVWVESEGIGRGSTFCFTLPAPAEYSREAVHKGEL